MIPCCWSEVDVNGKHITTCTEIETKLDKDNHQVRYFCFEHMKRVKLIRFEMFQKQLNKVLEYMKKDMENG